MFHPLILYTGTSRWDVSDLDSGVELGIKNQEPYRIEARPDNVPLAMPADKSFCGAVYGLVYIDLAQRDLNVNERLRYNNFAADLVCLQCNTAGIFKIHYCNSYNFSKDLLYEVHVL